MGLFNIPFNIFNIIISTFIFGLGIDYSIFITNSLLHEYRTGEKVVPTHKTSIILSVITTILGVGVLIFAKHPALYSISLVSIIGILAAVLISFSIQPLLFRLFIGSTTKRPINLRLFIHSVLSFTYYGLGGFLLSLFSITVMKIIPLSKKIKMKWFHKITSKFMGSVLYLNPFVKKTRINKENETFIKPAMLIANHTSFLDILAIGMQHPKIIFLVNDWLYNSPIFGKAVQLAGFYPVSSGIEKGVSHLQKKVEQGYSLMSFPEGTRSTTNKIKRFHKGAFYLAEKFNLDIVPVLIHGNSEVLPKGSFIIKNGSITVKILGRIKANDTSLGENYTKRAKQIGAYFREEFQQLRNEIEDETYFHPLVLEEYRYKGDALYKNVKTNLQENKSIYKKIMDTVDKKANILHLSKDFGQLDFLLTLDGSDRTINTFIENKEVRSIFKNSFLNHKHPKLKSVKTIQEAIKDPKYNTVILNVSNINSIPLKEILHNKVNTLIVLKENCTLSVEKLQNSGFEKIYETKSILILKK
jgi:1-acyl-sn-glycerol-3-phosphate acyltransferase